MYEGPVIIPFKIESIHCLDSVQNSDIFFYPNCFDFGHSSCSDFVIRQIMSGICN